MRPGVDVSVFTTAVVACVTLGRGETMAYAPQQPAGRTITFRTVHNAVADAPGPPA